MPSAFDAFDRIFCINLDRRPDRWARVQEEFRRIGILERVERVAAIERPSGGEGCRDSHVECVRLAAASRARTVLIFEDDVVFEKDVEAVLARALEELSTVPRWDVLFLGGEVLEPAAEVRAHLFRGRMLQTHAYALNARAFPAVAEATVPIDAYYARRLVSWGVRPPCAFQATDESDVSPGVQDRARNLRRQYRMFVSWPRPIGACLQAGYSLRRRVGQWVIGAARRIGLVLRFEAFRPRLRSADRQPEDTGRHRKTQGTSPKGR